MIHTIKEILLVIVLADLAAILTAAVGMMFYILFSKPDKKTTVIAAVVHLRLCVGRKTFQLLMSTGV